VNRTTAGSVETSGALRWLAVSAVAAGYLAFGLLGLVIASGQAEGSLIWPSAGLALGAVILLGWPAAIGVFIGAASVAMIHHRPLGLALLLASGAATEATIGAALLRLVDFEPGLDRLRDVLAFFGVIVLASAPVGATVDLCALLADGALPTRLASLVWVTWWLGNVGGSLIVAPMLLVTVRGTPTWKALAQRLESWILLALLAGILALAFGAVLAQPSIRLFVAILAFPFVAWAGLRLGPRGAILAALVTAIAGVAGTTRGVGPFLFPNIRSNMLALWAYATTTSTTAMLLAAAWAEREHAEARRRAGEQERARVEQHLRQVQRLESLGALAGGVAHDFNNILATIRGSAELASMGRKLDRDVRGLLDGIERATDRGATLCAQLLTYAGQAEPTPRRVYFHELLGEMEQMIRVSVPANIHVELAIDPVPPIPADPAQIRQVLMAMVVNAAEAIGDTPGTIRIASYITEMEAFELHPTRHEMPAGPYAALEVKDNGSGMDLEQQPRVFEPFYTTKFPGRGLGLSAALGIVHAHGGAIDIDSEVGVGTRFRVLIPVHSRDEAGGEHHVPSPVPDHHVLAGSGEDVVRRAAVRALEQAGWRVSLSRPDQTPRPPSAATGGQEETE